MRCQAGEAVFSRQPEIESDTSTFRQNTCASNANFYTAEIQMFGMFNFNGAPQKTFYACKAFRALLDTPRRVQTPNCEAGHVAVCAGLNAGNSRATLLLSNFNTPDSVSELAVRQLLAGWHYGHSRCGGEWPTDSSDSILCLGQSRQVHAGGLGRAAVLETDRRLVARRVVSGHAAEVT